MSLRNMLPAGLMLALLAGCAGTTTSTADEQSVGYDAAAKSSCCHKGCEGQDKAACEAKCKEAQAEKAAADAAVKG